VNRRLSKQRNELIDRGRPVEFKFEGETFSGFAGDVICSALYANDVRLVGRSFKYHRPRGSYSFAGHDSNAMFTDGRRTNLRGDSVPISPGMDLRAVNTFGSLRKDWMNITEKFSRFMPVGFYYKTFHRPSWLFPFHERKIRAVAGLGRINPSFAASHSPKDYAWCDVLVVGGGPAGLTAARAAGECGLNVLLIEERVRLGGSLLWQHARDLEADRLMSDNVDALRSMANVAIRCATVTGGHYADYWIALFDDTRMTKLRAGAVIYATGSIEQPAVFGHNDLPGVMLASAAQRLIRLFAVKPFDEVVVLAANSDGYRATLDLVEAGVKISAIADLRPGGEESELGQEVTRAGLRVDRGSTIYEAQPNSERSRVRGAVIAPLNAQGEADVDHAQAISADGIVVSVGWAPNSSLTSQGGVKFRYDENLHQLVPASLPEGVFLAGRVAGVYPLNDQLIDGRRAGLAAAKYLGRFEGDIPARSIQMGSPPNHPYPVFKHAKKKNFVDFDEDVHLTDFVNARQEGYDSVELMKRYSTVGMGPSQGKLSNMNAVRILAKLNGKSINETGTTTARPFYQPAPIGHLAGRRFHPMRRTPMHDWHRKNEAAFFHAGDWYRPEFYNNGKLARGDCILKEALQVRASLGLIDVGTLGKILVNGPDAVAFLERIYTGKFDKLAIGKYRYGIALDESGIVIEDGVIARLAHDRFYVTATSSGVAGFYREALRWAQLWKMNVSLSNATGNLTAMNLAGPNSRAVLSKLTDIDLAANAFPYLGVREGIVAGVRAIVMRVGFVGELGYEVHVPAGYGEHVWQTLYDAGKEFEVRPFGVEAQRLLRLEKGHLIIGQDTDALTHPYEAGVEWVIGKDKPFFVGQRSLKILAGKPLGRKLVGLAWPNGFGGALPEECNLIIHEGRIVGRVTSIAARSTLGYPIAMAFLEPGKSIVGSKVKIRLTDRSECEASVVKLPFYDPENARQVN
jgi:sarcosine oxidase, subunit alpha